MGSLRVRGRRPLRSHVTEHHASVVLRGDEFGSELRQAEDTPTFHADRLDEVSQSLSALEIEDLVTVRDTAVVAQRLEMVRRIADEVTTTSVAPT